MENEEKNAKEYEVEKSEVRETLDEDKLFDELSNFLNKKSNIKYENLFLATLFLTIPRFGFTVWFCYWAYKLYQHFDGKDLKKEEIVIEKGDEIE